MPHCILVVDGDSRSLRLLEVGLAQAGYRNRFGHPAPGVLERYRERGIRVVESARCGAATWTSSSPDAVACQREVARRYWHHFVR